MGESKPNNYKTFRAADNASLWHVYLDHLVKDFSLTKRVKNIPLFKNFIFDYHVLTYPDETREQNSLNVERAMTLASHTSIGFQNRLEGPPTERYSITFDMSELAFCDPELYRHVSLNVDSRDFKEKFCHPRDKVFQVNINPFDKFDPGLAFYKFTQNRGVEDDLAAQFYTYIKELQYYSQRMAVTGIGINICNKGAHFLQKLGLIEEDANGRTVLNFAQNTQIFFKDGDESKMMFAIDVDNFRSNQDGVSTKIGLKSKRFLRHAEQLTQSKAEKDMAEKEADSQLGNLLSGLGIS